MRYPRREDEAEESEKERGREAGRGEMGVLNRRGLTESSPKCLPIELLGGLPGFAHWVSVAYGPRGGKRQVEVSGAPHFLRPGPPPLLQPALFPKVVAPEVARPNCVSSPRTPDKSNRSSPAKCWSCSKGGAKPEAAAAGVAALAIAVDHLGPADKSRPSSCGRRSGRRSTSGSHRPGFVSGNNPPRPEARPRLPPSSRLRAQAQTQSLVRSMAYSSFIYLIG